MANRIQPTNIGGVVRVNAELEWKYAHFKAENLWFAFCQSLKISLQSHSLEELKQDMNEAVDTLFTELSQAGELDDFLKNHGWASSASTAPSNSRSTVDMSVRVQRVEEHDLQEAFC